VGELKKMLEYAMKSKAKDIIIIWEHEEILEIIRHFGIHIGKGKDAKHIYNLVFMIDFVSGTLSDSLRPTLYYQCVPEKRDKVKKR
jgi:hypothetical protein